MKRYAKFLLANFMASELSYWTILWHPNYPIRQFHGIRIFLLDNFLASELSNWTITWHPNYTIGPFLFIHYCYIKENQGNAGEMSGAENDSFGEKCGVFRREYQIKLMLL